MTEDDSKVTMKTLYSEINSLRGEVMDSINALSNKFDEVSNSRITSREFSLYATPIDKRICTLEVEAARLADHESRVKRVEAVLWVVETTSIAAIIAGLFALLMR